MHIGIIGLGVMGLPVAKNLMAAGFDVSGFDISSRALDAFAAAGGRAAESSAGVAGLSNVVLTLLPSAQALDDVVQELAVMDGTAIIAECSTLPISVKEAARAKLSMSGKVVLDCPLSGTGVQAISRDLVLFGSGGAEAYDQALPVFQAMSRRQHYLGDFGNGSRMKFVANHLVNIHNVAAAEAMVLGMKAGLDPQMVYDVISESAGSSRMFQVRAQMMAKGSYDDVSMALSLWRKDIETIAEFAADLQCPLPLFVAAAQPYYAALAQGLGEKDTAAVCAVLEAAARVVRPDSKIR